MITHRRPVASPFPRRLTRIVKRSSSLSWLWSSSCFALSPPRTDAFIQVASGYGLRSEKWAYMWYPESKKHKQEGSMLYDMEQDPSQYTNLADAPEYASIKTKLHERLMQRIQAASP